MKIGVPDQQGASLYIRPTMIATSPKLGLGASSTYSHFIITGPAGSYFAGGLTLFLFLLQTSIVVR